jgi:hypothetical protein
MSLRFIALYSPLFAIHSWIQGIFTFYSTSCKLPLYWEKIFSRNAEKFKNYILLNKEKIENGHTIICFDNESLMRRFEIDEEFVRKNQLSKKIRPSYT